jgi:hypothetical protein
MNNANAKALSPVSSVNATNQMQGLSESYRFISTRQLADKIEAMGYALHSISESKVRNKDKLGFQKHLMRFRLPNDKDSRELFHRKGEFPEIVVINSHDGTSSNRLLAGYFRMVCANGLISGSITDEVKIKHVRSKKINEQQQLEQALTLVADKAKQLSVVAERWKQKQMSSAAIEELAKIAFRARVEGTDYQDADIEFNLDTLTVQHRNEDTASDLWTRFNVIQENAVKAKLPIYDRLEDKDRVLRAPRAIDKLVSINKTLWNAAEAIAG